MYRVRLVKASRQSQSILYKLELVDKVKAHPGMTRLLPLHSRPDQLDGRENFDQLDWRENFATILMTLIFSHMITVTMIPRSAG